MGQETNCKNKYFEGKHPMGSKLNVYLMCWVPNPLKKNQMLGAGRRKSLQLLPRGRKDQGPVPSQLPSEGTDGAASKFLLRFGGRGR